ncbi:organic hydroperoxide resistance protein [Spirosoma montaniterrae]|uniref:Organic hydroperoxide resistance protein n=1 Tax=Spirosoma montaniterrae TaxID=1178516 RepID=A0A1P9X3N0_9BACT|nr:organic hydroperoxide resistance protein [Spirosoma montaniterrae]
MEKLYTASATAIGGREGHVSSSDNVLDLPVRVPKEFGGPGGPYTNPEQLFAAGYAACFGGALNVVIGTAKVKTGTPKVHSHVSIGKTPEGGFGLAVRLEVEIPGVEQALAQELAEKAHQICPYSNATRGNILVEVVLAK